MRPRSGETRSPRAVPVAGRSRRLRRSRPRPASPRGPRGWCAPPPPRESGGRRARHGTCAHTPAPSARVRRTRCRVRRRPAAASVQAYNAAAKQPTATPYPRASMASRCAAVKHSSRAAARPSSAFDRRRTKTKSTTAATQNPSMAGRRVANNPTPNTACSIRAASEYNGGTTSMPSSSAVQTAVCDGNSLVRIVYTSSCPNGAVQARIIVIARKAAEAPASTRHRCRSIASFSRAMASSNMIRARRPAQIRSGRRTSCGTCAPRTRGSPPPRDPRAA